MSDQTRSETRTLVPSSRVTSETHVMVPRRVIAWVCSVLVLFITALVGTGIWLDQRDATTKTANGNQQAIARAMEKIQSLEQSMALKTQKDKNQDSQLNSLAAKVDAISSQQGVNSQHLAAIESLLQELNDRLKEISIRLDHRGFGSTGPPHASSQSGAYAENGKGS